MVYKLQDLKRLLKFMRQEISKWGSERYSELLPRKWRSLAVGKACSADALPDRIFKFHFSLASELKDSGHSFRYEYVLPRLIDWSMG